MKDFPRWVLCLAFPMLLCAVGLAMVLLFGALPAGAGRWWPVRFLAYAATQLLWIVPVAAFFFGLDAYRRGFCRAGVGILLAGYAVCALAIWLL